MSGHEHIQSSLYREPLLRVKFLFEKLHVLHQAASLGFWVLNLSRRHNKHGAKTARAILPSQFDLPKSRIAWHFAHLLPFHLKNADKADDSHDGAKSSGADVHHKHPRHQVRSKTSRGQNEARPLDPHNVSRTELSCIRQRFTCHGQEG